ncbi:MAG: hypothetical protein ACI3Z7_03755 [Candidatus Aphodosoma sp.]
MKRINYLLLSFFFSLSLFAQQISNSGFETFQSDEWIGTGWRPSGWYSSNVKRTVLGITATGDLVHEDVNGRTGKCVRIHTEMVGAAGIEEAAPAWISLGKPWAYLDGIKVKSATAGTDGGLEFIYRPDTMVVWIKRTYTTPEDANIVVYSWKGTSRGDSYLNKGGGCSATTHYDEESDIRQNYDKNSCGTAVSATQVCEGHWRSSEQFPDWTEIKVPITYISNDIPEKLNIILSCANYPNFRSANVNIGAQLWVDDLRFIYSSAVHEISLGRGMVLAGFSPGTFEYTYVIGNKPLPAASDIVLKRSGRTLAASEYTVVPAAALGDTLSVTVTAEDGSSATTYKIALIGEISRNPRPKAILVGGEPISGFIPEITNYDITLPFGTTECPDITIEAADEGQTISNIVKPASLPGEAKVTVLAPDGLTSQEYTLNLSVGAFDDATLTGISVNGKPIAGFNPAKTIYVVELPLGTVDVPVVEYSTDYPDYQTIVVITDSLVGATVSVTPQGSSNTNVYRITYVMTESAYSYLDMITVGNVPLAGFDPEIFDYEYDLPLGTLEMPEIACTKGDDYQTVNIEPGGLDGVTRITVTAQSGRQSVYKITFRTEKSSISVLSGILLDGVALDGFDPGTKDYTVELPAGTVTAPAISYIKGDDAQTVTVNPGGLNGRTYIVVRAQDGSSSTYTLVFSVFVSSNSLLDDILLDNVSLSGFEPGTTEYHISLPRGTQRLPEITCLKGDPSQSVTKIEGGLNGTTRITVKAGSGAVTVYLLDFSVETNSNVSLQNIYVGGILLDGFDPGIKDYSVELPGGTADLPDVTFDKADDAQTVVVMSGGVNGVTRIVIRAEDGTEGVYTITFSVAKSENAFLKMIYVGDDPLPGFEPDSFRYDVTIPAGFPACPVFSVDKEAGQQVMVSVPRQTGEVRITVLPESGVANVYVIDVHYPRSENNMLMDLMLDGVSLDGFDPGTTEYSVVLPANTVRLPEISYTVGDAAQRVYVVYGGIGDDTEVNVMAEDGNIRTYTVRFSLEKSGVATLGGIFLDGILLDGFDPDIHDYEYIMPLSAVNAPVLTYTKGSDGQNVIAYVPAFDGLIGIDVVAEDFSDTVHYTVNLVKSVSSNTELAGISVNGVPLSDDAFVDGVAELDWMTADGVPVVTYEKGDEYQIVAVADAGINGVELMVIAADGSSRKYTLHFTPVRNTISVLAGLQVFNSDTREYEALPGFSPEVLAYDIVLPWRADVVPNIYPVPGSAGQTVNIVYGGVNDTTFIEVTSEDGAAVSVYKVNFVARKSSDASLAGLYVDGKFIPDFSPYVFDYFVVVDDGVGSAPEVTWDAAVREQSVVCRAGTLYSPATVTVRSEDGLTENTYTVNFVRDRTDMPNTLRSLLVGDMVVPLADGQTEYDVVLPYGTDVMPEIKAVKRSDYSQSVVVAVGGLDHQSRIDLFTGDLRTTYLLNVSVDSVNPVALTSLAVSGVEVNVENSVDSVYIVNVTETPASGSITTSTAGIGIRVISLNPAAAVIESYAVGDPDGLAKRYTLYFHYPADVIPNAGFTGWSATTYNGAQKPSGWTVPADCAEKYKATLGSTYTTGHEVQNIGNGEVKLYTFGHWNSIAGSVPGMMTVGSMSVNLKSAGNSTSSVSGGIQYRNTPDRLLLDYKPVYNKNIGNWRMLLAVSQSGTARELLYTGSYDGKDEWHTASQTIDYGEFGYIDGINLTVNSANTENADDLGFTAGKEKVSELHVRNPRFYFSNQLAGIKVDGISVRNFSPEVSLYDVMVDADYYGRPNVEVTGAVRDQQHRIVYLDGRAVITSMAEDGSVATYTLNILRPVSKNADLADIRVNGVAVDGFDPAVTEYTCTLDKPFGCIPDIVVEKGSSYQSVVCNVDGKDKVTFIVTAENNDTKTYTVRFVTASGNDTSLASLTVGGYDGFAFSPETFEYVVSLSAGQDLLPVVHAVRTSDLQSLVMTVVGDTVVAAVTAADGVTSASYRIVFARPVAGTSSVLAVLGGVGGFAPDRFEYSHDMAASGELKPYFRAASVSDTLSQRFTDDAVSITVRGDSSNTYNIRILRGQSSEAALTGIYCDGRMIDNFMPELHDYRLTLRRGEYPVLRAVAPDKAALTVGYGLSDDGVRTVTFNSVSEDLSSATYANVYLAAGSSASGKLADIRINGTALAVAGDGYTSSAGFDPDTKEYVVTVSSVHPKLLQPGLPDICAVAGAEGQSISVERGGFSKPVVINVTHESGIGDTYVINLRPELSSNATLADLALDYESLPGFSPDKTDYVFRTDRRGYVPVVTYRTADAFQTVDVRTSPSEITVTVRAEDGTENVYRIAVVVNASSNAYLSNIMQNGIQIPGFLFYKFNYAVTLPVGTKVTPEIVAVAGDAGQTVSIVNGGVNGTTVIRVVAADGIVVKEYSISYKVALSVNNQLENILLGTEPLPGFYAAKHNYTVMLPVGTETNPTVYPVRGDEYQTVETSVDDGTVSIVVTPQNAVYRAVYTVRFETMLSEYSRLSSLMVNGEEIPGFDSDKYEYVYDLPVGTVTLPEISWIPGDRWQNVSITPADALDGHASVEVVAQNSRFRSLYTVRFNPLLSDNDSLGVILIDGTPVDGFAPGVFEYDVILPVGTDVLPDVTVEKGDAYQTVDVVSGGVNGKYVITVMSQSGKTSRYVINFSVELSHNSHLAAIVFRHDVIDNFDPEIFFYELLLPYGSKELPLLFYELAEPAYQTAEYIFAKSVADTARIIVTAQDGVTKSEYRISFKYEKSGNASLSEIRIGGEHLSTYARSFRADKDFAPDTYLYNIELPYGTEAIPEITYTGQVPDYSSVRLVVDSVGAEAVITVTSQDRMNVNEYTLKFIFLSSDNAMLKSIAIDGKVLDGFDPSVQYYSVVYPVGTDTASLPDMSALSYETMEEGQSVKMSQIVPEEIVLVVTAPDGVTVNVYTVKFEITLSDNTLLDDILVNGVPLAGFSPAWLEYTYVLFPGNPIPALEGVKAEESQIVTVSMGMVNEPSYIYVEAEDGSIGEYTVHFNTTLINPGERPSLDDVAWTPLGDGNFQASTIRDNVRVLVYLPSGLIVRNEKVALIDPNFDIKAEHSGGTVLHFEKKGQTYIYVFSYDNQVITYGKFVW